MNISIFGLGYVGTVSAACLSRNGNHVIGVDTNALKVESIGRGESPVIEPGVDLLLKQASQDGHLTATTDPREAVRNSELSLICVGTPSRGNGSLNLEYIYAVAAQIGEAIGSKDGYHGVAIRSTVMPGTVKEVASIIERKSGKTLNRDFGVASNPEFLREGTAVFDFDNPPFTVIGPSDECIEEMLRTLYQPVAAPLFKLEVKGAEMLKYACNAFHAVKVTFANEIGAISKELGIDSHAVMDVFVRDTKLNISPYYLKPGFAFGGSCLPKDVRALTYAARRLDVDAPLLESLMHSNATQIQRAIDHVIATGKKRIGILGLSFKSDTDDMRESPIVHVVETLLGKGYTIQIFDSNVNLSKLIGANKRFIEQEIPHISALMKSSIDEVLETAEVIVVANKGKEFESALNRCRKDQMILDLVRITNDWKSVGGTYDGICW